MIVSPASSSRWALAWTGRTLSGPSPCRAGGGIVTQGADLIEEVARIEGYDRLPATSLKRPAGRFEAPATPMQNRVRAARRAAANRGYQEAVTWSFCREDQAALFGGHGNGAEARQPDLVRELDVMRPSALVHLLLSLAEKPRQGAGRSALFRGWADLSGRHAHPANERSFQLVRVASAERDWKGARQPDVFDAKADALGRAGSGCVRRSPICRLHPKRVPGGILAGPARPAPGARKKYVLAEFGEIHPGALKALGVEGRVLAVEAFLDAIPGVQGQGDQVASRSAGLRS